MSSELQQRARQFIQRTIPKGMKYVRGSFAENVIATYAKSGRIDAGPEFGELLSLTVMESQNAAAQAKGEEKSYLTESSEILQAIFTEAGGN